MLNHVNVQPLSIQVNRRNGRSRALRERPMTSRVRSTHVHWTRTRGSIRMKIQVLGTSNTRPTQVHRAHTRRRVAAPLHSALCVPHIHHHRKWPPLCQDLTGHLFSHDWWSLHVIILYGSEKTLMEKTAASPEKFLHVHYFISHICSSDNDISKLVCK